MSLTQPAAPLRVVIAEDAVLLREGLRRLQALGGLGGRHPDVGEHDVGLQGAS